MIVFLQPLKNSNTVVLKAKFKSKSGLNNWDKIFIRFYLVVIKNGFIFAPAFRAKENGIGKRARRRIR